MTVDSIMDELLKREGGFRAAVKRPDGSIDPDTMHGVTEPIARKWFRRISPLSPNELRNLVTPEIAKLIFQQMFIGEPGFTTAHIPYEPLRIQLIDFGVNNSPARAIRWFQRILRFPEDDVTGKLDAKTLKEIAEYQAIGLPVFPIINDALVAARSYMIDQSVDQGTMRKADEEGVESRALSFFLAKP